MVVAFLLAGWPVYRLTRPAMADVPVHPAATETPAVPMDARTAPLEVEAIFAPPPVDFQIKNLDVIVLAGKGPTARFQARWTAVVPPVGVDLVVGAHWPAPAAIDAPADNAAAAGPASGANPAAVRVRVRFADGRLVEKSFWADAHGTLTEVFTVPGAPTPAATP